MPRVMEITTPLGADLLFYGMHAREGLSRLFEYQLDLLSLKPDVNLDDILGKNVTVKLALPDDNTRYFNGFVTRFSQGRRYGRYTRYSAVVRPWLWFLTRTADCRIFQEMTVPDIVKQVFGDHPTADFKFELTGTYKKWTYCVQYRETDFNFVSRLLEQEGIYYYVRHTDGHNTVVLTDSTSKHVATAGYETLPFISPEEVVRPELEYINRWEFTREIQPGVYVHDDYDLERPSVELKTRKALTRSYAPSDYEVYDYPGLYIQKPDGEQYAGVRIDEFGSQFEVAQASSNAKGINVGALLTLEKCPREDQNCEHLILGASHDLQFSEYEALPAGGGTEYRSNFTAMTSKQQFRPRRLTPKPFVQGPQTAVVVGPAGDEIYTDKHGRVKVQFHWDRYGKKDENSSCWIRVSQPWAGKGWGSVSTPRIGQEVIVDFLEGDPDQPIITGRVYNAENQPPFGFPAGAVLSGIKSNTHKGQGYNEISMDDTAKKEKIKIHAQHDMETTVEHDQTDTIHNNRSTKVDGTETLTIDGVTKITITSGTYDHNVAGNTAHYHVSGALKEEYDTTQTTLVGGAIAITSKSASVHIQAATEIKLSVGSSTLLMTSGGKIKLTGINIGIDGSTQVNVHGGQVLSVADGANHISGGSVVSEAKGTNTVQGSTVLLNP